MQKPGFLRNTWLHTVNSVKTPVSLSEVKGDRIFGREGRSLLTK
ncbi:MAG: hypothetical protein ACBR13_18730 [Microcoleus sp.]